MKKFRCPVCNRYLNGFQDSLQFILDKGASVIAVTPETSSNANIMIGKPGMTFSVIADTKGEIMKKYDLVPSETDDKKLAQDVFQSDLVRQVMLDIGEKPPKSDFRVEKILGKLKEY